MLDQKNKDLIQLVLDRKSKEVSLDYITPDQIIDYLKEYDFELEEDWMTNGWDHDFWMNFFKDEENFMFSGSWYYGGYKFGLDPDKRK